MIEIAGHGPPPKDPSRRARTNKGPVPTRVIQVDRMEPGDLPDDLLPDGEVWHPATLRWWRRWCESPLAQDLPAVDWSELRHRLAVRRVGRTPQGAGERTAYPARDAVPAEGVGLAPALPLPVPKKAQPAWPGHQKPWMGAYWSA